jgi:hypothetical protein
MALASCDRSHQWRQIMTTTRDTDIGQPRLLTGTFRDRASAERAYDALISRGYTKDEVNLLMSDTTRRRHFSLDDAARGETELGSKAAEGAATGGLIGALIGAGIPEERARVYETDIRGGGIVMGVRPRSAEDEAYLEQEWRDYGAENVHR